MRLRDSLQQDCVCPSDDEFKCVVLRYRLDLDDPNLDEVEPCECGCHESDDDFDEDEP